MDNEWYPNIGLSDECPAQPTKPVQLQLRGGDMVHLDAAIDASWRHIGDDTDVMGWRYTDTQPAATLKADRALQRQEGGDHYKSMPIQPVEYIHRNGLGFCEGAIVKYVSRWRNKNGLDDLRKARHFIDLLIELESCGSD